MSPLRVRGDSIGENVGVAFTALRANKMRSALTSLGVIIGVATVVTMATIVRGIQNNIMYQLEIAGPSTFYVLKIWSTTPLNPENLPKNVRIRPDLSAEDAHALAALPELAYAGIWGQIQGRIEVAGERTPPTTITGADEHFIDVQGGQLSQGRWFTRQELLSGASVAVINENRAGQLFGRINPIGKQVRVAGRPMEVIGLYQPPANIFTPAGSETGAVVPFTTADHQFHIDKTNGLFIVVRPHDGVLMSDAQSAVIIAMRERRHLHPGDGNTFDLIAQDQILATFNQLTGAFFLVMIVLASVALLVGGIGVMAIMMVSVTDRTHEIGIRRACGATRLDILVQFLIEAGTLTGAGGVIGIVVGIGAAAGVTALLGLQPEFPVRITAVAVVVSVGIGLVFGVIPARRAALLDPVDALRYE